MKPKTNKKNSTARANRPNAKKAIAPGTKKGAAALKAKTTIDPVRVKRILADLHALYPAADCALHHRSAYELLVATILSAQCTDERVNLVTPELFQRWPEPQSLARADQSELEAVIRSTGFFRNKAKNLIGMAQAVTEKFHAQVPDNMDALLTLPGVARKTANVLLGTWFKQNDGVVVDTHVGRLSLRLGLARTAKSDKDAGRIEQHLMQIIPQAEWTFFSHALIWHGRKVCVARNPKCPDCPLASDCPSARL